MKSLMALSFVLVMAAACGGGGTGGGDGGGGSKTSTVPILSANGTISIDGRSIVLAYAVAGENGKAVYVVLSDAPTDCSILAEDYLRTHILAAGTYVFVGLPSFDKGAAERSYVDFTVASKGGRFIGSGSSDGKVEVLDATETAVTISVDYHQTLESIGDCVASGEFSATRCPLAQ